MIIKPKNKEELINLLKNKALILYGMGGAGLRIAQWCDENDISYIFADKNATDKQNTTEKKVILPSILKEEYCNANIVVSSIIYADEISNELIEMGFNENQIFSYKIFMPDNIMWSDLDDNIDWDLMRFRVEMFSEWITDDIVSIVDYGAGKEWLRKYINPDVKYYPVDYIKRNEHTILCDLNFERFPEINADVSVCSGVLEFINTAKELLQHVCKHTNKMVIVSYLGVDHFPDIEGRRASAYISDLSEHDIISIMDAGGFELEKKVCDPVNCACMVYLFRSNI